ncbi:conserved hypothetical protein [Pyrenophora tritici-repentis Pt-1C-BFP]|uniref:DUF7136 domain-containing protein n=1 Tax=Pyrenophora tritici-repentis (strain Pt-1C-BFP) TaxID=426418 RepID=B2WCU1_PYRTR|nr:uncharacterized protein PTRG_07800 [Pyrenophora tritici-repentis Pt-1C-BFP]EDU50719.1 conserved hypothetical protein [Pyrenophora tritici-repentis Pt-1C-BFP]
MQTLPWTISWMLWLLIACSAVINAAVNNLTGLLEVDLVFPQNDSYAPTNDMPIIFAIQNPELAPVLDITIMFDIYDRDDRFGNGSTSGIYDIQWANLSSNGPFRNLPLTFNSSTNLLAFTSKDLTQDVDLVSATENKKCSDGMGVAFNITDNYDAPLDHYWPGKGTCGLVALPLPTPDPCRVKINSAAASSISASITKRRCDDIAHWNKKALPADCPADENAAQRVLVGGLVCFMAVVGALGFILM